MFLSLNTLRALTEGWGGKSKKTEFKNMLTLAILIFIASFLLGGLILFRIYMDRIFNIKWFVTEEEINEELNIK